jgi:hypothetical protein
VPWHRAAIHRKLVVERRRDDASAPARAKLLERPSTYPWRSASAPADDRTQSEATVACIENHEDMLRGDPRDVRQPALQAYPRSDATTGPVAVDGNDVAILHAGSAIRARHRVSVARKEQE